MLQTIRTQLRRQCTCLTRSTGMTRVFSSTSFNSSSSSSSPDLPWFVDPPPTVPSNQQQQDPSTSPRSTLSTAPVPTIPPSHLSSTLHPLHRHLSTSPFFDGKEDGGLTYIHAREADPMGSWCDWVVICTLKEGRERSLRGAVESIRTYLGSNPVEFLQDKEDTTTELSPFSPPTNHPSIHGLPPTTASKHARSRARSKGNNQFSATRQDQTSGWALLDAGTLVIHVMTREARKEFGQEIERVWKGVAKEEGLISTKKEEFELREREKELSDNMRQVAQEIEREKEIEQRRINYER
ncbi:hypothetical protein JCM3765_001530 [Sporobolomyces pararoseus]